MANKAAMRRLLHRVLASGCFMLLITLVAAIATTFLFSPTGFSIGVFLTYPVVMANSVLQIDAFAPATNAPSGPLRGTVLALWDVPRNFLVLCRGTETEQRPGVKRLRFLIGEGSNPLVQDNGSSRSRSLSVVVAPQLSLGTTSITVKSAHSSHFAAVLSGPEVGASRLPWSSLPVSQKDDGVSHSFLLAILEAWRIPHDMTTY